MLRKIYILFLIVAISIINLQLSTVKAQSIDSLYLQGDTVVVAYTLPLYKPKADLQATLRPTLCSDSDTIHLDAIRIRGTRYEKVAHREFVLDKQEKKGLTEPRFFRAKEVPSKISDTLRLPEKQYAWLLSDTVHLFVDTEEDGCCRERRKERKQAMYAKAQPEPEPIDTVEPEIIIPISAPKRVIPTHTIIDRLNSPVLRPMSQYRPYSNTMILSRDSGALYVHFDLDKVELRRDYMRNAATLDSIVYLVNELMHDTLMEVRVIQIVGLASVEGKQAHNSWLAGERGMALQRYIQQHISIPDSLFETANGGEAWSEMKWQVENNDFYGRDEVLNIINTEPNLDLRERKIKAVNDGKTYKYLLNTLLKLQRNSGYIRVYYDLVPDTAAETINQAIELIGEERFGEAAEILEKVKSDPRSWNTMAVALYMSDRKDEAILYFRKAADTGDTEAEENLKLLKH